jgi:hypothetical protein
MTQNDMIRMAREAGWSYMEIKTHYKRINRFAALVAAHEQAEKQEPVVHQNWCASLTQLLTSNPPQPAPCNCKRPAEEKNT